MVSKNPQIPLTAQEQADLDEALDASIYSGRAVPSHLDVLARILDAHGNEVGAYKGAYVEDPTKRPAVLRRKPKRPAESDAW